MEKALAFSVGLSTAKNVEFLGLYPILNPLQVIVFLLDVLLVRPNVCGIALLRGHIFSNVVVIQDVRLLSPKVAPSGRCFLPVCKTEGTIEWIYRFRCLSRQSSGLGSRSRRLKKQKMFLPHPRVRVSIVGSLRDREVAYSASDRQGSNFESFVWRTVSSQSSHHPQEVLMAQFSLYVNKGGLKPESFYFILEC